MAFLVLRIEWYSRSTLLTSLCLSLFLAGGKTKKSAKKRERDGGEEREDGEPALTDSPATPEQLLDNNEAAPDDTVTTPQVVEQPSDSSSDSANLTSESTEDVQAKVRLEQKDDVTKSPDVDVDTASSLESTNEGADSSTSTNEDATNSERTSEQIAGLGDSETAAGNVSTEAGVGEDTRAGQSEREPEVLNDVQRQDVSEEGRDEL